MNKLNTYGIPVDVDSLVKASEATPDWPANTGYSEIYYDTDDGFVGVSDHVGDPMTSYTVWPRNVVVVGRTVKHHTPQGIMNMIRNALS